jgi:predicted tellurium resistance membrane protein TerC
MENLFNAESLTALLTLSLMEIVLGIDNIIFVSILTAKVDAKDQSKVRNLGISLALVMRILLLFSLSWLMGLTNPLFTLFEKSFSSRDLILILGGLFLIAKSTFEIHSKVEGDTHEVSTGAVKKSVTSIIIQILILDLVFSLDSVITAVGMVSNVSIMVAAMCIAMLVMLASAKSIGEFVDKHPTIKILALSFLILIGVVLIIEGMGAHVGKGYIYFAMFFSLVVELINMRVRSKNARN